MIAHQQYKNETMSTRCSEAYTKKWTNLKRKQKTVRQQKKRFQQSLFVCRFVIWYVCFYAFSFLFLFYAHRSQEVKKFFSFFCECVTNTRWKKNFVQLANPPSRSEPNEKERKEEVSQFVLRILFDKHLSKKFEKWKQKIIQASLLRMHLMHFVQIWPIKCSNLFQNLDQFWTSFNLRWKWWKTLTIPPSWIPFNEYIFFPCFCL